MWFYVVSSVVAIASLLLGLFIYLRNPKNLSNRYFLLMAVGISFWVITLIIYYSVHIPELVLWIGRINYAAPTIAILYMFKFVQEFPKKIIVFPVWLDKSIFSVTLGMAAIAGFTPWVDKNEHIVDMGRIMEFGALYGVWVAVVIALLVGSLVLLVAKIHRTKGTEKIQLKYLMAALTMSFGYVTLTNAVLPYVFAYRALEQWGPVAGLWLTGITSYAIVRHRFLDITTIVARAVTYTLMLATIVAIEVFVVMLGVSLLPRSINREYVAAAGAILIVLSYDYLRTIITRYTEKIFFQGRYDTEDVLAKLTQTMASVIDIKRLCHQLLSIITEDMRIVHGAFVLVDNNRATHVESINWPSAPAFKNVDWSLILDNSLTQYVFEDLEDGPIKDLFREQGIIAAFPLRIKHDEIGLLLLGPKASGDIYAERDLELLSIFAPQAAVAMNNAKAYQEIQKFSKTLEKKVEERTAELESTQREKLAKAKELLKIKDEFVFIATHDLATPVTALRGYVDILQNVNSKLPKEVKNDIGAIGEATERLKTLVEDLLEVARGESGTIKVTLAKTNIAQVLTESAELVHQRAVDRNVTFTLKLDKRVQYVMADEHKLREVVENLFSNAIKYNKEGGTVDIVTKVDDDRVVLTIADTGIGIPDTEQDKVFTKFYRSDSDEARMQSGTGLGLFVVKMLVTKMRGTIRFVSHEGQGTTFTLTFLKS